MSDQLLTKVRMVVLCFIFSISVCSGSDSDDDFSDDRHTVSIPMHHLSSSSHNPDLIPGHNDQDHPQNNRFALLKLIGVHEALHTRFNIDQGFERPDLSNEDDVNIYVNQLVTLSQQNGYRKDGRATWQATDLPGLTDNANRCGAFCYQVSRNFLYTLSGLAEVVGLGLLSIAQMYDFDQDTKDAMVMAGTILTALAPVLAAMAYTFLSQKDDRVKQLKRAADAYNVEILGLEPLYPDASLRSPNV